MIRIRRIFSTALPHEHEQIEQVQEIFRLSFAAEKAYEDRIPAMLDRPFDFGFRTILLVSNSAGARVTGFSLLLYLPEIESSYLDFIAVRPDVKSAGLGSALYEATRETAVGLGSRGMYLEALPDDPESVTDPAHLKENRRRLRFYEHYGVRPIIGTAYELPVREGGRPGPHLLFDPLERKRPLGRRECRAAVRLILERKYSHLVEPQYVRRVVQSIRDDPVRIRSPRYVRENAQGGGAAVRTTVLRPMAMISSTVHEIHHVKERGYVERPARIETLQETLRATGLFNDVAPRGHTERFIREVHDPDFVNYLKAVCEKLSPSRPIYPYVFPVRRPDRRPKDLSVQAGYYCIDTFTPLDRNAYIAARAAADVALSGAEELLSGRQVAYSLCRPPGHHAGRRLFGGFCYFNNAAVAAQRLQMEGTVAILDLDFHHGNGTQDIFWNSGDVLTVSIHGTPTAAYPYFSGFADEIGEGFGRGCNRNFPLPEDAGPELYLQTVSRALGVVERFRPVFLILSLGYDTMRGDPTGSFDLQAHDMGKIASLLGDLRRPLLVVQEGGYSLRNLRSGSLAFFRTLSRSLSGADRAAGPRMSRY
jgi:acetoin utilization deacetylase AcuC-like enzyme/GNAT superfamily N-acetyltransferase